ncbi:hypothetical protein GlitD10_1790 [Gloeomargarita lithophora Alchichica-D10]|uniref:Uncharacterized protein n=1 Tax=Gloeomargarita lithophora Alchichica-D10 TaxID=1188229 RepID=A0A1J0ADV7_9CYAN|nr:hypothetical protein [Gloeomargarita lithophora]APB34116.1 hypothetical protein GlitD10_1790 [Gloeomargarita lithophora Alchichica-D10]
MATLRIVLSDQVLEPESVCQDCPLANHAGVPRWLGGRLGCGHPAHRGEAQEPLAFECAMGFRVVALR